MFCDLPEATPLTGGQVGVQTSSNGPGARNSYTALNSCLSSLFPSLLHKIETR